MAGAVESADNVTRLIEAAAEMFRRLVRPSVVEWAESQLYMSPKVTERAGMFSTDDCAYMREPLECFKEVDVDEVDLCFGSQTGKTTIALVGLAYSIENNPRRTMFALPTDEIARRFVKNRWLPLVDSAEAISRHKPENSDEMTNFDQNFDTCSVFFTGVGSAGKVSSEPIALLFEDEIDKYPAETDRESDARSLLEERVKSFVDRLIFRSSTPTTRTGNICKSFEKSDRRYYFMPCPRCGKPIRFEFANLKWYERPEGEDAWDVERVRRTAHYVCPECGGAVTERDRQKMIGSRGGGEWVSTNPKARKGHRGYHLNSMYSPTLGFGAVAAKFIEAKETPGELQNFINSWLAEPWEEETFDSDPKKLKGCELDYNRGDKMGSVRVMTVDVQRRDLRFNVRGYDGEKSYLIDWGTLSTWEDADAKQELYGVSYVGVDINYRERQGEVYEVIYTRRAKGWMAIVGAGDSAQLKPFTETTFNPFTGKKRQMKFVKSGISLLTIKSSLYKGEIAARRSGTRSDWHVYRFVERGYVRELFAESPVEKYVRGRRVREWKVHSEDNHQFDLECYQLAMAHYLRLHKYGAIRFTPKIAKAQHTPPAASAGAQPQTPAQPMPAKKKYIPIDQR